MYLSGKLAKKAKSAKKVLPPGTIPKRQKP